MTAAIYARKSTAQAGRDDDDKSVARQVDNARAFAHAKGWTVAAEHVYVDDAVSGAETRRLRAKQRMLDAINTTGTPPFDVLVMQANDRLSRRDGDEAFGELKAIARRGISVWFYASGEQFAYGDFASNTLGFLRAEVAAEYRRGIAAKTRESHVRKATRGHVCGGRVFGYDNVRLNSHVERRVNEAEAVVVRRIYEMYAKGLGLPSVAHALNAEGAACPRPQQGRVSGWAPSSVREVLKRDLYRGIAIWGRKKKRDVEGHLRSSRRPESEWVRAEVPELRVIPEALAEAVDARFKGMRERALRLGDGRLVGRPPKGRPSGEGSKYLLVGLLTCGECGGSMEVLSSASGGTRQFHYRCLVARRKGPACCGNRLPADMGATDAAVLRAVQGALLDPRVVTRAITYAERAILRERHAGEAEAIARELAECEQAARRLTSAVAEGGDLSPLVAALAAQEARRTELRDMLAAAKRPRPAFDQPSIRQALDGYVRDWVGLLRGHVPQAQQVLRRLVRGRLTMTPVREKRGGFYRFEGIGTVRPLLSGLVPKLASPKGLQSQCTTVETLIGAA
jgi:site-specific DNA recombinase